MRTIYLNESIALNCTPFKGAMPHNFLFAYCGDNTVFINMLNFYISNLYSFWIIAKNKTLNALYFWEKYKFR